jgi:hypothetical protein
MSPPNIVNLVPLTFVVQEYNYECCMADPRNRAESKAAVAACHHDASAR